MLFLRISYFEKFMSTVFHSGEILIQTESGVEKRADKMGNKLIRDHIIDQHKKLYKEWAKHSFY